MTAGGKFAAHIEWFHAFAAQSHSELANQASEANREAFLQLVRACLPGLTPPQGQSPEEFASTVRELRDNERQWNRALSSALIEADDLHKSEGWQSAVARLSSFAESCPWALFREVAQNQAANYGPRTQ